VRGLGNFRRQSRKGENRLISEKKRGKKEGKAVLWEFVR